MTADANPETKPGKVKCAACGNEISAKAEVCDVCNFKQFKMIPCAVCKKPIPSGADRCNECETYQGWRRHFPVSATVLSLLLAFFGVLSAVFAAASNFIDRESSTRVKVTSADDVYLYLKVWNTGRKPSTLIGYRLSFDGLPIQSAELHLSKEDVKDAKNVITPGPPVKLTLSVDQLIGAQKADKRLRYSVQEIQKQLAKQRLTLEIYVEESNDPSSGFPCFCRRRLYHTRVDTFTADRVAKFIIGRMS